MHNRKNIKSTFTSYLLVTVLTLCGFTSLAQAGDRQTAKTITVTVEQKGKAVPPALTQNDFFVYENGVKQEVISVSVANSENSPLNLAVVIQEGLPQVNSELKALKSFIKTLPAGSQVMVAYINGGFLDIRQPFTTNLEKATHKLRVVNDSTINASPYLTLLS